MSDPILPELLPCPFCGGEAHMIFSRDGEDARIVCKHWGDGECMGTGAWRGNRPDAADAWNRRVEQLQQTQEVVGWMLEWSFNGEETGRRFYDDEKSCLLDAQKDGGVCRPVVFAASQDAQPQRAKDELVIAAIFNTKLAAINAVIDAAVIDEIFVQSAIDAIKEININAVLNKLQPKPTDHKNT